METTESRDTLFVGARTLKERLEPLIPGWEVQTPSGTDWRPADGMALLGPGTLGAVLHLHGPDGHVDIGFQLNRKRADAVIWDCAAGWGDTTESRVANGINTWMTGTLPVLREVLKGRGEHADHFHGDEPGAVPGWHTLYGPVMRFGHAEELSDWVLDNLPGGLIPSLVPSLDRPLANGIKIIISTNDSEVRINGRYNEVCSKELSALPWPRQGTGFIRCFLLAVAPERAPSHA